MVSCIFSHKESNLEILLFTVIGELFDFWECSLSLHGGTPHGTWQKTLVMTSFSLFAHLHEHETQVASQTANYFSSRGVFLKPRSWMSTLTGFSFMSTTYKVAFSPHRTGRCSPVSVLHLLTSVPSMGAHER